jgi:hypothetical protein
MRKRIATLVLTAFLCCTTAHGEGDGGKNQLAVDGDRAKAYVAYLCSDAMEGRASCTEGYRKAADWVAENFRRWGLKPAGEDGTYFQTVTIREFGPVGIFVSGQRGTLFAS